MRFTDSHRWQDSSARGGARKPLRVGLLIVRLKVPAWVARIVGAVQAGDYAEITAVIVNQVFLVHDRKEILEGLELLGKQVSVEHINGAVRPGRHGDNVLSAPDSRQHERPSRPSPATQL